MLTYDAECSLKLDRQKAVKFLTTSRDILELGAYFYILTKDESLFVRQVAQLKAYYQDHRDILEDSPRMLHLIGIYLTYLLSRNMLSKFHIELEMLEEKDRENIHVAMAIQIEQRMMEGSYRKIILGAKENKSRYLTHILNRLIEAIRGKLMDCATKAYTECSIESLKEIFIIENQGEVVDLIKVIFLIRVCND
mmetsp:Transcript_14715/g.20443  ORF Transcript_14715/g.20443 Transcript_14715/m.20443 type:complete len:194 (-) Transcript_14715:291-872(-)